MGHNDGAGPIQRKVTLRCELGNRLVNLSVLHGSKVPDLVATWCVALASERVIDRPAHTLNNVAVHGFLTR